MTLLLAVAIVACHKEEQAVVGVAQNAVNAEHKAQADAQAAASLLEHQRAQLESIPLPAKSLYINVRDASSWANPFLTVNADSVTLRVNSTEAAPGTSTSAKATGTKSSRSKAARRRKAQPRSEAQPHSEVKSKTEVKLRPEDLAQALVALPPTAWRYGRVIAIAESPTANPKDRPNVRRNVEQAMQKLNDLGIVVDEWPVR
jgi:type II secretory pathway pseudopilin PulG